MANASQEIGYYLSTIHTFWAQIMGEHPEYLNGEAVKLLELRAPKLDINDRNHVQEIFNEKSQHQNSYLLLPKLDDYFERNAIRDKVLEYSWVIPSLSTLFEDLKFLEPLSLAVRMLHGIKTSHKSTFQEYRALHTHASDHIAADVPGDKKNLGPVSASTRLSCHYVQIWLFAMRKHPYLVSSVPRKEKKRQPPLIKARNDMLWRDFEYTFVQPIFRISNIAEIS